MAPNDNFDVTREGMKEFLSAQCKECGAATTAPDESYTAAVASLVFVPKVMRFFSPLLNHTPTAFPSQQEGCISRVAQKTVVHDSRDIGVANGPLAYGFADFRRIRPWTDRGVI
jgi:hypothetical protein